MSAVGARYLAPDKPQGAGIVRERLAGQRSFRVPGRRSTPSTDQSVQPESGALPRILPGMSEKLGREVRAVSTPKEAVDGSDFVQAATAAWDPVFDGHWVEKGMYVASIGGSDASNKRREIDDETIGAPNVYFVQLEGGRP